MSDSGEEKYMSEEEEVLSEGGGDSGEEETGALGKRGRGSDEGSGDDNFDDGDEDAFSEGSFKSYSDGSGSGGSDDDNDNDDGDNAGQGSDAGGDTEGGAKAKADSDDDLFGDAAESGEEKKEKKKKDKKEKKEKKKDKKKKKEGKEKDRDKEKSKSKKKEDAMPAPKSKRRRVDVERFFLRETEVADEDEYESEEELGEREEREITQAEAEAIELHRRRMEQTDAFQSKSASEIADEILNRYRTENRSRGEYLGASGDIMTNEVTHRSLVPGVSDPTIWMIRVKLGMEQQLVRSILFKAFKAKSEGKKVGLKSAFCTASKGYIYLEAFEEVSAREMISGLSGLYISTFCMVPIGEMTALLNVKVKKKPIRPGQWVRMKRGPLKGDLAKVISISEGGDSVVIQAVPRIDYSAKPGDKKSKVRPLQAPFESARLYSAGHQVTRRQFPGIRDMCDFFENNFYSKGFLVKEVKVDLYINDENVTPRLEELTMFRKQGGSSRRRDDGDSDDDEDDGGDVGGGDQQKSIVEELAELQAGQAATGDEKKVSIYRPGDVVQITGGEYAGLKGRVLSISDATKLIKLKPLHDQLAMTEIDVEIGLVVKYIQPGSHVKVIDGQHVGETGRVVVVNKVDGDHIAAIFTDGIKKEITVNVSHLQVSSEVTIGLNSLEGYELYDFVTLGSNDCGVVVMVGTEQLTILNPSGVEKTLRPMEIRGKANMQSNRATALDNMMNQMKVGDTVTVMEGEHAKRTGTIKHVNKATVWLHCDTYFKHSGIFPVRGRSCSLAGASARSQSQRNDAMAPPAGRGAGRGGAGRGGRGGVRDEIIGKTVKITRGGYKGHMGVVREKMEAAYSVELAAKFKVVKIPLSDVVMVGDRLGSLGNRTDNPASQVFGMATPHLLGQTPRGGFGSSTPMHAGGDLGSSTPRGLGNETPNSMYGAGSQSPHYSAMPHSPYHPSGSETPRDPGTPHDSTPHGVGGGKKVESINWDSGMLSVFTAGEKTGQQAALLGRVNQENNMVQVMLLNEHGERVGTPLSVPCTQLRLADLVIGANAIVVSGQRAGAMGHISMLHRNDVCLDGAHEGTIFKAWQIALIE